MAQFPEWLQQATSPRQGALWWMRNLDGAASHEEIQMDRHAMRPRHRSPKVAGPGQGATWQARDRDMDRSVMQSEAGCLFSGSWRGKGRRGEEERERERERNKLKYFSFFVHCIQA